jgi:outer membrane protein OmpA-like peptidoglycan-associated protein
VLSKYPRTQLEIVGHTDDRGSDASTQTLSERRPVATNTTPDGRTQNRRVEIVSRPDDSLAHESPTPESGATPAPTEEPR